MTISSGSWAAEPDDFLSAGLGPTGPGPDRLCPEDLYGIHEERVRRVLAELDFEVYAVDRSGRGARGVAPARAGQQAPSTSTGGAESGDSRDSVDSDAMTAYETQNGEITWVELRSGDWTSLEGPYVTVRSYRPGAERHGPLPELEELVERERDRAYDQIGVDEGDSPGRVRALREWITVGGEPTAVQLHEEQGAGTGPGARERTVWAGRLLVHGAVVLVCGRGIEPAGVELAPAGEADFERFLAGRGELLKAVTLGRLRRLAQAQRRHLGLSGLDAHRAVLEFSVERALAVRAHRLSCGRTRPARRLRGTERPEHWEAAVRQQMRLGSEDRAEASAAVESMVNHLVRLAERADWLLGTPDGRAAVEELVRYTVFASHVPSLPAQRAWEQLGAGCSLGGGVDQLRGDEDDHRLPAERAWLAAWEQWRRERSR